MKDEKPRSSVIPRLCDCGFLSNAAVDSDVERALTSVVFPVQLQIRNQRKVVVGSC